VHDLNEFFGRESLRSIAPCLRIDHVFANVIFDDDRDEAVQGAPARGCLLQDIGTFLVSLNGAFDSLYLTAQPFDAIEQFGLFFRNMTHYANLLRYYTRVGYIFAIRRAVSSTLTICNQREYLQTYAFARKHPGH
jgi:hypothetical protein